MCDHRKTRGAAYVEFLIVAPPMMLLWLGLAQIGLLYGAHIIVKSATARAGRAAVVIIPDDREGHEDRYDNVPPFRVGSGSGLGAYENATPGGRLAAIRRAARIPLAPVSPSLGTGLGAGSLLVGFIWTEYAVAVTFPDGDGGYITEWGSPTAGVTTRVTYLYKCPIPVANRLLCNPYFGADMVIPADTLEMLEEAGIDTGLEVGIDGDAASELNTVGADNLGLIGLGIEAAGFLSDDTGNAWRFYPLRAEVTLPLQGRLQ